MIRLAAILVLATSSAAAPRPNILWLTAEDIAPNLGCYGDAYAQTPNIDALAAGGIVYRTVWSSAPVCAPARTAIITGVSPTSIGAEHMRSLVTCPAFLRFYPQLLREAGYYCTNNSKEDYNIEKPGTVWDDSSAKAHWRNRAPGQPFFAVFNIGATHEGQIRKRPHEWKHDPAKVRVPARHPDAREVRLDWAQYYDQITAADGMVASRLAEVKQGGLSDSTIVFFYGDNGPGMPGYKRSARDSGLHVPLVVHIPEAFRSGAASDESPGTKSERPISFLDLAPTVLSLAGVRPPDWMQGRAFLGPDRTPDPEYIFGFRGRMDERGDLVRSLRDRRYVYVRNFMPHLPEGQHVAYMFETPSTKIWKQLFDEGKLTPVQRLFWERRAPEELYDLHSDPDETRNLADSPEHREVLGRMRQALHEHLLAIRDVGFLPEGEIHTRSEGSTPYEMGHDGQKYPLDRILAMAELASSRDESALPRLRSALLNDPDSAVRYWAAMGILIRGQRATISESATLEDGMKDQSPYVRIVAAEAIAGFVDGPPAQSRRAGIDLLVELADCTRQGVYVAGSALNALDRLGARAASAKAAIARLPQKAAGIPKRIEGYIPRLMEAILEPDR